MHETLLTYHDMAGGGNNIQRDQRFDEQSKYKSWSNSAPVSGRQTLSERLQLEKTCFWSNTMLNCIHEPLESCQLTFLRRAVLIGRKAPFLSVLCATPVGLWTDQATRNYQSTRVEDTGGRACGTATKICWGAFFSPSVVSALESILWNASRPSPDNQQSFAVHHANIISVSVLWARIIVLCNQQRGCGEACIACRLHILLCESTCILRWVPCSHKRDTSRKACRNEMMQVMFGSDGNRQMWFKLFITSYVIVRSCFYIFWQDVPDAASRLARLSCSDHTVICYYYTGYWESSVGGAKKVHAARRTDQSWAI